MKEFWFSSAVNPLAAKRSLVMLKGHRVPLPAGSSYEPMMRGCNQRALFEELVKTGLRHLVVPLNGPHEDTCLFARRHPGWEIKSGESAQALPQVAPEPAVGSGAAPIPLPVPAPAPAATPRKKKKNHKPTDVLYDLEHRDEGAFMRLKFLLDAAEGAGVMLGFTLFSAWPGTLRAPLSRGANVQGISLEDALLAATGKEPGPALEKLEAVMRPCVDWIAAEVRGRSAVWVQTFRGLPDDPGGDETSALRPLLDVEARLAKRLILAFTKSGEDRATSKRGPWAVLSPGASPAPAASASNTSLDPGADFDHVAPFDVRRELLPARDDTGRIRGTGTFSFRATAREERNEALRRPALCSFAMSDRDEFGKSRPRFTHELLWRTAMNGAWPIVPGGFENRQTRRWFYSARMSEFFKQWAGRGYIRPCPEILRPMPRGLKIPPAAGTDGCGRYMVFFEEMPKNGVELATPPGNYRYYWLDPIIGRLHDMGDGLTGGERCRVPEYDTELSQLLIIEQEELPDPMSVW